VSMDSINFTVVGNETQFLIEADNAGNIPQNFTFTISTASFSGTGIFTHSEVVNAGTVKAVNFTIPSTDRITRVEMSYTDSDGTVKSIEQRYDIIPGTGPLMDILLGIWSNEVMRGVVITLLVLVILIFIWKVILKK
jgi:hypothetical protein